MAMSIDRPAKPDVDPLLGPNAKEGAHDSPKEAAAAWHVISIQGCRGDERLIDSGETVLASASYKTGGNI